eukprot:gene19482-30026_t
MNAVDDDVLREAGQFEQALNDLETSLDEHILQQSGAPAHDTRQEALDVYNAFEEKRKKAALLEEAILTAKEKTWHERLRVTGQREKVKMTQAELACLQLEVHAEERKRNQMVNQREPAKEDIERKTGLLQRLIEARKRNREFAPVLAGLNSETVRLENQIAEANETEKAFVDTLTHRYVTTGQELNRVLRTEEEWAELKLTVEEQEAEIERLKCEIVKRGGVVATASRMERDKQEEAKASSKGERRIKKHFSVPAGSLRDLVTIQGYGLQAIRSQFDVAIDLQLGDSWGTHIATIAGLATNVDKAKDFVAKLGCVRQLVDEEEQEASRHHRLSQGFTDSEVSAQWKVGFI